MSGNTISASSSQFVNEQQKLSRLVARHYTSWRQFNIKHVDKKFSLLRFNHYGYLYHYLLGSSFTPFSILTVKLFKFLTLQKITTKKRSDMVEIIDSLWNLLCCCNFSFCTSVLCLWKRFEFKFPASSGQLTLIFDKSS